MNILILTYQGSVAGSTFSIYYLARGLAENGHRVFVGCREGTLLFKLLQDCDAEAVAMPLKKKFDSESIKIINDLIDKENIEIVNAQSSIDRYISIIIRKFYRKNIKLIHTRRQIPDSSLGKLHGKFYAWGADAFVAVSGAVKDALVRMGLPASRVKVIRNGTPLEKYKDVPNADVSSLIEKYDIQPGEFVVGCVSRHKKQEQLINALNYIESPRIKLIFAGISEKKIDYSLIDKIPSEHDIIYCGGMSPEESLRHYKLFDAFVLPSTTEGLSQSLLEAMYLQVPVVTTNAGGNPELIIDGESGLLFEDGNIETIAGKIKLLASDADLRRRLAQNAKRRVETHFTIERVVRDYEGYFVGN